MSYGSTIAQQVNRETVIECTDGTKCTLDEYRRPLIRERITDMLVENFGEPTRLAGWVEMTPIIDRLTQVAIEGQWVATMAAEDSTDD